MVNEQSVTVKLFPGLMDLAGKRTVKTGAGTVESVLEELFTRYGPEFRRWLFDEEDNVRVGVSIIVNGDVVGAEQGFKTPVSEGSTLTILLPVAGG